MYAEWSDTGLDKGVCTYILNLILELFLIFLAVRLAWGAYRYFIRPRSAAANNGDTVKKTTKQRGRFDTKGHSVQDADFIDLKDDKT